MSRPIFSPLIKRFVKIYFSDINNKENEYKKTIFYTLKDLGGVYIKFLQILCVMHHFTDGWAGPKELEVFNKVQLEDINIDNYIKEKDKFSYIEKTPFASGSFAQLYKGQLKTGEVVAIKVLRPSISRTLRYDLGKLKRLINIFSRFISNNLLDYKLAFDKFANNSLLETDYEREIANMDYFVNLYKDHPYVVIPKPYKSLCSKNVIVQDYIEGPTLADVISKTNYEKDLETVNYELTGSNIWTQIMIVGGEALRTAMTAEYVYGDPHPGNIILLKEEKIAFIDFGIIANKPVSQENFYLWAKSYYDILIGNGKYGDLIEKTYLCFCPDLANALKKCATDKSLIEYISEAITDKLEKVSNDNSKTQALVENGHFLNLFTKYIDNKNALNIKIDMRNFQLLKAMQAFLSSVTTIDNKENKHKFSKLMIGAMKYALYYCELNGIKSDSTNYTKYSINESYEILINTLTSLAEGDEFLFQSIFERMFQ